jgi:hypothetical protein
VTRAHVPRQVGRPQITEGFYNFLKAFIEFRRAAIGHGVPSSLAWYTAGFML